MNLEVLRRLSLSTTLCFFCCNPPWPQSHINLMILGQGLRPQCRGMLLLSWTHPVAVGSTLPYPSFCCLQLVLPVGRYAPSSCHGTVVQVQWLCHLLLGQPTCTWLRLPVTLFCHRLSLCRWIWAFLGLLLSCSGTKWAGLSYYLWLCLHAAVPGLQLKSCRAQLRTQLLSPYIFWSVPAIGSVWTSLNPLKVLVFGSS